MAIKTKKITLAILDIKNLIWQILFFNQLLLLFPHVLFIQICLV